MLNASLKQIWMALVLFSVIVPGMIMMVWYGMEIYSNQLTSALVVENQSNNLMRNHIEQEVKRLRSILENKSDTLSLLLTDIDDIENLKKINLLLKLIVKREPAVHEVMVFSKDIGVITAIDSDAFRSDNQLLSHKKLQSVALHWGLDDILESPEFITPSLGRHYMGTPYQHEGFMAFNISVPINDFSKTVLIANIDIHKLWSEDIKKSWSVNVANNRVYERTKAISYMVDHRGSLIAGVNGGENEVGELLTHLKIVHAALADGKWSSETSYVNANNELVYGALTSIPLLNWSLVSEVVVSEITQPIWQSLIKFMLLTLFGIWGFVWLILVLANKTLEPIQQACKAIKNVSKGDYRYILKPSGIHELDVMIAEFDKMVRAREHAEIALLKRENDIAVSLDSIVEAVISIDETGKVLTFNKAAEKMFGYAANDIIGKNASRLASWTYAVKYAGYLQHYIRTGESEILGLGQEIQGRRKNEEIFPMRLSIAELPKDNNDQRRFIGSCLDLTDMKNQEEKLRRSQKMEALGKLTGGVAHDYNNMLGIILGFSDLLNDSLEGQPKLAEYARQIQHAGERGAKLTQKLLSFSRDKKTTEELLNINELLQDERHMLEKILTARFELAFDLEEDLWPVWLDSSDLEDAIINICINAMHAMGASGHLTIQTRNIRQDECSMQIDPGEYVELSITDTGRGMSNETRERIFDPFFSTKGDKGTGLGLSQVYGFVQRCGGEIQVHSELRHGTQMIMYFPRNHANLSAENVQELVANPVNYGGNETILVVDDDPTLLSLMSEIFNQQGYAVISANSAKQALKIIEHEFIDILISDVIMPEMDGYQLAEIIQEKYPKIKIQLISGFRDYQNVSEVNKNLNKDLIHKPFRMKVMAHRIRDLLDGNESLVKH